MYQNIVKIRTTFSNRTLQDGFGFVIGERDNCLYVATALHVVVNEDPSIGRVNSMVSFYQSPGGESALVTMTDDRLDLALMKIAKPSWYEWRLWCQPEQAQIYDDVRIIGHAGQWTTDYQQSKGMVVQIHGNTIEADFAGLQPGCSGGPLMKGKSVVGMVLEDAGTRISAVDIGAILRRAYECLEVDPNEEFDLPFLAAGGSVHFVAGASAGQPFPYPLGYALFAECMVIPRLSMCATGAYDRLAAELNVNNQDREFQNLISSYGLSLKYYINFWNFGRTADPNRSPGYLRFGVSRIKHNPQIRFDRGAWMNLQDGQGQELSYSKSGYAFEFGIGTGWKGSTLEFGMDVVFIYSTEHLAVDLLKPYEGTENHFAARVGLYLGYLVRNAEPTTKVLR
ncbi:MAG: serine protease [Ignavibacteriales bacterium]|nr:serine protease [Ignavibacteriales bacterium]